MSSPTRVLVVDDHLMSRRGLATILLGFDDISLAGEANNGAEALDLCATSRPDVILMDLIMPDMDGVAATRAIRERYPEIQVIVLTNWDEYDLVQCALAAGAGGYLLKNIGAADLAGAIRAAHPVLQQDEMLEFGADLTDRERDVLALMIRGLTNCQIGSQLYISRATVKYHVSGILSKMGATSRTEAAARAVQSGLIYRPRNFGIPVTALVKSPSP